MRKRITNYSYAELSLVFKEYFDVSKITETLNIQPTNTLLTNRTKKNEELWIKNGWEFNSVWELCTKNIFTFSTADAITELFNMIGDKIDLIRELVTINHGRSEICIVGHYERAIPAITLETEQMEKLVSMNASLEYDLYR